MLLKLARMAVVMIQSIALRALSPIRKLFSQEMMQPPDVPSDARLVQMMAAELADMPESGRGPLLAKLEQDARRKLDFDMLRAIKAYRAAQQSAPKVSPNF